MFNVREIQNWHQLCIDHEVIRRGDIRLCVLCIKIKTSLTFAMNFSFVLFRFETNLFCLYAFFSSLLYGMKEL